MNTGRARHNRPCQDRAPDRRQLPQSSARRRRQARARRRYLRKGWVEVAQRRKMACVPEDVAFAPKPKSDVSMVVAAIEASVACAWALGDTVYGSDKTLRVMLEGHDRPYLLSVHGNERLMIADFRTHTAKELAAGLSPDAWRRFAAGQASKGPRLLDWARIRLFRLPSAPRDHCRLIRRSRSITDPTDVAFYVTFAPVIAVLPKLAVVAGLRWTIEECFHSANCRRGSTTAKLAPGAAGICKWRLSMLALVFFLGLRAQLKEAQIGAVSGKANKRSLSSAT